MGHTCINRTGTEAVIYYIVTGAVAIGLVQGQLLTVRYQ